MSAVDGRSATVQAIEAAGVVAVMRLTDGGASRAVAGVGRSPRSKSR